MEKLGAGLKTELKKEDKITDEEELMILEDCNNKHGDNHSLYEQIA